MVVVFFVEEIVVELAEFVEVECPFASLVEGGDGREFSREGVDGFTCTCAGVAGGVAAYGALSVDEASLNFGGGPAGFDCG